MAASEENLCTSCGLCCDGSLFAEVELGSRREAFGLEAMGLDVDESDDDKAAPILNQPCAAIKNTRCSVYKFRPKCCRTFECRLLQQVKGGAIQIEDAKSQIAYVLQQIQKIKTLLAEFPPVTRDPSLRLIEQCQEALLHPSEAGGLPKKHLEKAIASLNLLIQKTFLNNVGILRRGPHKK
jgi:Fe-S-cluster containining protein